MAYKISCVTNKAVSTHVADTAADALAKASAFAAAGNMVMIVGPGGEDLSIEELERRAANEASRA